MLRCVLVCVCEISSVLILRYTSAAKKEDLKQDAELFFGAK